MFGPAYGMATGDWKSVGRAVVDATKMAATAYAFHYVGDLATVGKWGFEARAAAHAMTGGVMAEATGGDFRSGFLGAGVGALAGGIPGMDKLGVAGRMLVGGLAARAGGGDFTQGAITATIAYLFNDLMHTDEASPYVNKLRAGSPLAAEILDAMAADPTTKYHISVGPLAEIFGGGSTELVPGAQPSFWDRLLGRTNLQVTVVMRIDQASAEPLRALAHELGHGYTYLKGGYVGSRLGYDQAIDIENTIMRQLDPSAYMRPRGSHGRWYQ